MQEAAEILRFLPETTKYEKIHQLHSADAA